MEWTPPPPEPVEIVAPRAITWTRVTGGELWTFVDSATFHDDLAPAQNPVLARAVCDPHFSHRRGRATVSIRSRTRRSSIVPADEAVSVSAVAVVREADLLHAGRWSERRVGGDELANVVQMLSATVITAAEAHQHVDGQRPRGP
jgi:hypothetical protein